MSFLGFKNFGIKDVRGVRRRGKKRKRAVTMIGRTYQQIGYVSKNSNICANIYYINVPQL